MTEKVDRTPFRWVFWTEEASLNACPICGEKTINKTETFRTSGGPGTNRYACRLYFKCGHMFGARAMDRESFKAHSDFFSELDKRPPGETNNS